MTLNPYGMTAEKERLNRGRKTDRIKLMLDFLSQFFFSVCQKRHFVTSFASVYFHSTL